MTTHDVAAAGTTGATGRVDPVDPVDPVDDFAGRSFESLVTELEEVARRMDSNELGIEEAADLYALASTLHRAASARLERVAQR
jgi:exodeoxyribonuclease VII small subunit